MNVATKENAERRFRERNKADGAFQFHRENCPACDGKSYFTILGASHPCEEGHDLAVLAEDQHKAMVGAL